jgi:L-threonylcarbamoyladenylate synthase
MTANSPEILTASPDAVARAGAALRAGKLVAFPTETVYGLGANALDGRAVARIFAAKGRPKINPVIVHGAAAAQLAPYVVFDNRAQALAAQFWPGPLTLILPRAEGCAVSELCSAGLPTLAVRVPDHPVARALLAAAEVPVAAPSANASGTLSPTSPLHVAASLGGAVDMILAGGNCAVGLESTVLDLTGPRPAVLRPGAVTPAQLSEFLGIDIKFEEAHDEAAPRSPGQLLRHYAPRTKVRLRAVDLAPGEALLAFGSERFMGIRGGGAARALPETARRNLSESGDLGEAAANLFRMLYELDRPEHTAIAVMDIPETGLGLAINDRLRRAARAQQEQP